MQSRHSGDRISPKSLFNTALCLVHSIESGDTPGDHQQDDQKITASCSGAATAAANTAKNTGEAPLPIPHDLIQIGRLLIISFPGILTVS